MKKRSLGSVLRGGLSRCRNILQHGRLASRRRQLHRANALARPRGVVAVVGLLRSSSGLGESARIFSGGCRDAGFTVLPIDLSGRLHGFDRSVAFDQACPHRYSRLPERHADTVVVHLNGQLSVDALAALDLPSMDQAWRAAYWHWELPAIPESWRRSADYFNEIWVPSEYVRSAVAPYVSTPVRVLPHCIRAPKPTAGLRQRLGIPEDAFVALTAFDFRSSIRRKNPIGAIRAFKKAFGNDPTARLIVKHTHAQLFRREVEELMAEIGDYKNIISVGDVLTRADMSGLIAASDTVVSLHRSEGFGLVPAEAMLLGKPVVATDWSATQEFLDNTNGLPVPAKMVPVDDPVQYRGFPDQVWADPDIDVAAGHLAELRASEKRRQEIGASAYATAKRMFSPSRYEARLRELLILPETQQTETQSIGPIEDRDLVKT